MRAKLFVFAEFALLLFAMGGVVLFLSGKEEDQVVLPRTQDFLGSVEEVKPLKIEPTGSFPEPTIQPTVKPILPVASLAVLSPTPLPVASPFALPTLLPPVLQPTPSASPSISPSVLPPVFVPPVAPEPSIEPKPTTNPGPTIEPEPTPTPIGDQSTATGACQEGQVNVNTALKDKLLDIIHIGEKRAEELIQLRPFSSLDDLDRIKGIGPARVQDIKNQGLACIN